MYSHHIDQNTYQCELCPHLCKLQVGQFGKCLVRKAIDDGITLDAYGKITTIAIEPIEKKPFYHFYPGIKTLSIGFSGCSLKCKDCANIAISQNIDVDYKYFSTGGIVQLALENKCKSVCMTYNEPLIYFEFLMDLAEKSHHNDLLFILKTNAYIERQPWKNILDIVDAINIDYKGPSQIFSLVTGSVDDYVIYDRIVEALESDKHIEISIPVYNEPEYTIKSLELFRALIIIYKKNTPCHCLKIFQDNENTLSDEKSKEFYDYLSKKLPFVYAHNIFGKNDIKCRQTVCPDCKKVVIERNAFDVKFNKCCEQSKKYFIGV